MSSARRPAGPGTPYRERRDATTEAEEIDELDRPDDDPSAASGARQAERDAHASADDAEGPGRAGH